MLVGIILGFQAVRNECGGFESGWKRHRMLRTRAEWNDVNYMRRGGVREKERKTERHRESSGIKALLSVKGDSYLLMWAAEMTLNEREDKKLSVSDSYHHMRKNTWEWERETLILNIFYASVQI